MRDLGIGRDVARRGMLIVYDLQTKRMRIEVGDALQGDFPDGFVGYLMREHAASFFAAGNPELAPARASPPHHSSYSPLQ